MAARFVRLVLITGVFVCLVLPAIAQPQLTAPEIPLPDPTAPLHERVARNHELMMAYHLNEGVIMADAIFFHDPAAPFSWGNYEDAAGHTAVYLAGLAHKYAVTKDPAVRKEADTLFEGILKLEKVTGVPGVVARGFYKTDEPRWHEKAYFFSEEWHDSPTMPGYRWQGDLSSDKFTDFLYGVGTYWEFCADDARKAQAAAFMDRFVGRCVDNNYKMIDADGKMTLWGNFCPDLPHQPLNALEMLAALKVTERLTGNKRYGDSYRYLIDEHQYDEETMLAKTLWPDEWNVPWDDNLAGKAYYMLLRWEDDKSLLMKYRMSLNRHLYSWERVDSNWPDILWYLMLYQMLTGEEVLTEKVVDGIKNMQGMSRGEHTYTLPTPDGPRPFTATFENSGTALFRAYWFGRHYGFIDPNW